MSRPSDLFVAVAVVAAIVWLGTPTLLLPALLLTLIALGVYRWRREGKEPNATQRYQARLIAGCVVIAIVHIPMILKMVPPNGMYGFRTSTTRSSVDIWYSANAFMGWAMLVACIASAGMLLVVSQTAKRWQLLATFLLPILCALAASFAYLNSIA